MRGNLELLDVGVQIPLHFRCPISLELMRDPVTVCTGQTYDRSSIESWVTSGNTTCPVTRSPLSDPNFIPNHTLRRLIQDWCVSNRSSGVERIPTPKQPADALLVRSLLNRVSSESSPSVARLSALHALKVLACDSERNRAIIASVDAQAVLLSLVFTDGGDSELALESLAIVVMFHLTESECASVASQPQRLNFLSSLLFHSSVEVRVNSAAMIEIMTDRTRSPEIRAQVCNTGGIVEGIIEIVRCHRAYPPAIKVGIKALLSLCLAKQSRNRAVAAGAAEVLVERLSDLEKCDAERALAIVELLCRTPEGCSSFSFHPLAVPLLVKTLLKVSDRATESAAGALLSICSESERSQAEAVTAGVMTQLLLLVQSESTDRAKRKAQMLLKLLRQSWPNESVPHWDDVTCGDVFPS